MFLMQPNPQYATPVMDALVATKKIPDLFSLQLCGTVPSASDNAESVGGKLVKEF